MEKRKLYNFFRFIILILDFCSFLFPFVYCDFQNVNSQNNNHEDLNSLKTKRFYQVPSFGNKDLSKNQPQIHDSIVERFQVNANTIIRTHDSKILGAKYLNETELPSNEDCLYWCWESSPCNLAVYDEKARGSCYLFDCGSNENFKCKFTPHNFYTSSILQTNRHSYDLSQWGAQMQHEKDLVKLRSKTISLTTTPSPTKSSISSTHSLGAPMITPITTANSLIFAKSSPCKHYQFECRNNSECIAIYNVCDGIPQCVDGSDEGPDLECHKSRINTLIGQPPKSSFTQQNEKSNMRSFDNVRSDSKVNGPNGFSFDKEKQSQQTVPVYNYPKTSDVVDPPRLLEDQTIFSKNQHPNIMANELRNSAYKGNWNQYYQGDVYNGGDSRTGNGYLVDPEYINNNYNRDNTNQGYWPSIGKQQYDTNDPIMQPGQSMLPLSKPKGVDEWSQPINDANQDFNYENMRKNNIPLDDNKPNPFLKPIPQDLNSIRQKSQFATKNQDFKVKSESDSQKVERQKQQQQQQQQQIKVQSQIPPQLSNLQINKPMSHSSGIVAVSYMHDSSEQNGRETNSAVIALTLGLCITALLVFLVGCRMKSIKRKIARRGRSLAHDADYLVNGMYL